MILMKISVLIIQDDFDDDEDEPINGGMGTSVDTDEVNTLVNDTIDSFSVTNGEVGYEEKEDDEYEKAKCSKVLFRFLIFPYLCYFTLRFCQFAICVEKVFFSIFLKYFKMTRK